MFNLHQFAIHDVVFLEYFAFEGSARLRVQALEQLVAPVDEFLLVDLRIDVRQNVLHQSKRLSQFAHFDRGLINFFGRPQHRLNDHPVFSETLQNELNARRNVFAR